MSYYRMVLWTGVCVGELVVCSLTMKHTRVASLNARQAKPVVHLVDTSRVVFVYVKKPFCDMKRQTDKVTANKFTDKWLLEYIEYFYEWFLSYALCVPGITSFA